MPTPITEITTSFTYSIADEIFGTATTLNRTATSSYTGPDRVWVFVDADTGIIALENGIKTTQDDGGELPIPFGTRRVEVTAADDPAILGLLQHHLCTIQDQTVVSEELPDGTTITFDGVAGINDTYDLDKLSHNGTAWVLPALSELAQTWDDIIHVRNNSLLASDGKISPDMPDAVKQPWLDYRAALRALPATFNRGEADETAPWKITLPTPPGDE
jgi:hypothetical protein